MKNSPRLLRLSLFASLTFFVFCSGSIAAQTGAQPKVLQSQLPANAHAPAPASPLSRIAAPRLLDAPDGARVTIASDTPLDDYTSRLDGNDFYVLIPHAVASFSEMQFAGHGFTNAGVEQRDESVVLSFRLQPGASVRVSRGFNRLDVIFKTQAQSTELVSAKSKPVAAPSKTSEASTTDTLTGTPNDERETIRQMRLEIEALETRIKEIETRQAAQGGNPTAQAAPANATVAANTTGAVSSHPANGSEHDEMSNGRPSLQIQGFADVNFRASNQKGTTNSFALGQLDLFLTSRLSEKFSVLGV